MKFTTTIVGKEDYKRREQGQDNVVSDAENVADGDDGISDDGNDSAIKERDGNSNDIVGSFKTEGSSMPGGEGPEKSHHLEIATNEAKEVQQVKVLIFAVLITSIVGAAVVYLYVMKEEDANFEKSFSDDAAKIFQAIGSSIERAMGALESLSVVATDFAFMTNQSFPFVSIPKFGVHCAKTMTLTGGIATYLLPIVTFQQRQEWEKYAAANNSNIDWAYQNLRLQDTWDQFYGPMPQNYTLNARDVIYGDFGDIPYNESRPNKFDVYLPQWHTFPLVMTTYAAANYDWYSISISDSLTEALKLKKGTISRPSMIPQPDDKTAMREMELWCEYYKDYIAPDENCMEPSANLFYPVLGSTLDRVEVAQASDYPDKYNSKAVLAVDFYWRQMMKDILSASSVGIVLVVKNTCGPNDFTYQIDGPTVTYLGFGDRHDRKYDGMVVNTTMNDILLDQEISSDYTGLPMDNSLCEYSFFVYPSDEMKDEFYTNNAIIFSLSALAFIILPFLVFLVYERKVKRQKDLIMTTAERSDAIVSSMFPSHIRDKLYQMDKNNNDTKNGLSTPPVADLYPDTTVLFADITDFTVWCSVRDPLQVFNLLETLFMAFDKLAARRRIFKVETVGDCYVSAAGLPDPRRDHATVMAKFAQQILSVMATKVSELETRLGPGTSALTLRIGLNSGPVTAGVLRGSNCRFQLFGDTVNTAARMEANSLPGRIMCSRKTADLLIATGKEHWVSMRSDMIDAKGKGMMQCFWVHPKAIDGGSVTHSIGSSNGGVLDIPGTPALSGDNSDSRLVNWMSELFASMLTDVVRKRSIAIKKTEEISLYKFSTPREEVVEKIAMPKLDDSYEEFKDLDDIHIDSENKALLQEYIVCISDMYVKNPFHNFEHACHVVMTTQKLLSRVVKPTSKSASATAYGLTSDPLAQFGIVFSAFIHDVAHPGVSNAQLVKEKAEIAIKYDNNSVAEQNSVTLAWDLLMQPRFAPLRRIIMATDSECIRFRQIIVNSVMATDLFDSDLKNLRETRWKKVFAPDEEQQLKEISTDDDSNRRATIIMEHIIQASDVSHTMQHWHIYQKWNRRLFQEMSAAYVAGRSEKDPAIGWYEGELWFFDNYIIPLAKKLKTCGVFGVSCDELLDYASDNRAEWAAKGRDIVSNYVASAICNSHQKALGSQFTDILLQTTEQ